jgi:pimeloyl-ACP methyl ester carboxylesterase
MRVSLVITSLIAVLIAGCAPRWATTWTPRGQAVPLPGGRGVATSIRGPERGRPLLFVHGFGSSSVVWDALWPLLPEYRSLAVDALGFGDSSRVPGDYSPDTQADALVRALDQHGIERTTVIAHSLGATFALTMALRAPERVERLVLLAPFVYPEQLPWALRDAARPGLGEWIFGGFYRERLDLRFAESFANPDVIVTETMLDRARAELSEPGATAAALQTIRELDLDARAARWHEIAVPVTVVAGREDRVVRLPFAEALARSLPAGELVVLPQCGHFPSLEAPRETVAAIRMGAP